MTRTDPWGVDHAYQDAFKKWHDVPDTSIRSIHQAMGSAIAEPAEDNPVLFAQQGKTRTLPSAGTILLENGESREVGKRLPADLPLGYHKFQPQGQSASLPLIVSPSKCWLPADLKTWGWAVQLYAARSEKSWGIGDFAALEQLARWSAEDLKAGMLLLNPLSAAIPLKQQQASPYYPGSRRFFNPIWLEIEAIPGARDHVEAISEAAKAGRRLNETRLIDRDHIFDLKIKAAELLWEHFPADDSGFRSFCRDQGRDLDRYAVFCALAEKHNSGWHSWPEKFHDPESAAVADFARDHQRRIDFHKWLQWLIDGQLARCSKHLAIMQDLPIGVDPDGADVWAWQQVYARGMGVGAPPDEFNTQGQNWGLPPFIPHRLREVGYEPFIQTIRAVLRNGGGLRIDHVMGLFRLFWIPNGAHPKDGAFVRYNADELLSIVALESHRAQAYVVGEDLGTVEPEIRKKLASRNVLSYRLLWFEKKNPRGYPKQALAAVTTHDLPTVAGLWTGSDLKRQHELHLKPNEEATAEIHQRLARTARCNGDTPLPNVVEGAYGLLAHAPSRILTAALEDAACVEERPNIPATTCDQNPNWSQALPVTIEKLVDQPLPRAIARILHERTG